MSGFFGKIRNFILDESDEDYQDDYFEEEEMEEEAAPAPAIQFTRSTKNEKVLNLHNTAKEHDIVYFRPTSVDDAPIISKCIKENKTCVIKIEDLSDNESQSIADFVAGAVFVLGGTIEQISEDIFIAAPGIVNLRGDFKKEIKQSASIFSFMK